MKNVHIISVFVTLVIVGLALSQSTSLINSGIFVRGTVCFDGDVI